MTETSPVDAFQDGLIFEEYVASMKTLKRHMLEQYAALRLSEVIKTEFTDLIEKHAQVLTLVMTEDYCPDSVLNLPIVARLAEAIPSMTLRIIYRSDYLDLANRYPAADGYNHIPTVIFMTPQGQELGVWRERSAAAREFLANFETKTPQPPKTSAGGETTLAFKKWAKKRLDAQKEAYRNGLWKETAKEFMTLLKNKS
ncbi:MAG TPA: thioredoxin family protein [Chloroflexi bacterium]|nr:MAG: hypothetical protein B6243_04725 [Anaerolineaceae bacterium 4572_5.2]HEY85155.1 thioredoxin family protein [Chloroflexota bacterium]